MITHLNKESQISYLFKDVVREKLELLMFANKY